MKKKPLKIVGLEQCVARLPEKDREVIAEEIKKMFSDPEEVLKNSKPVDELPVGTKRCPRCGEPLTLWSGNTVKRPGSNKLVRFLECEKCDLPFIVEALS